MGNKQFEIECPPPLPLRERILIFLDKEREPVKTIDIAKAMFGENATCKMVNPTLYSMERDSWINKISDIDGWKYIGRIKAKIKVLFVLSHVYQDLNGKFVSDYFDLFELENIPENTNLDFITDTGYCLIRGIKDDWDEQQCKLYKWIKHLKRYNVDEKETISFQDGHSKIIFIQNLT